MKRLLIVLLCLFALCGFDRRRRERPVENLIAAHGPTLWIDSSRAQDVTLSSGKVSQIDPKQVFYLQNNVVQSEDFSTTWGVTRATISTDTTANPVNGATDADELVDDATAGNTHYVAQTFVGVTSGVQYTYSIYGKYNGRNVTVYAANAGGGDKQVDCDLQNGAVFSSSNDDWNRIAEAGGGWYRCTMAFTATATGNATLYLFLTNDGGSAWYDGDGSSSAIIWGAHFHEAAKSERYIKTAAATITRDTTFTQGTAANQPLRTVGSQVENLLQNSNDLDNATYWDPQDSSMAGGSSDPFGGSDAHTITANSDTDDHLLRTDSTDNTACTVVDERYVMSAYLKAGTQGNVLLLWNAGARRGVNVDLSDGSLNAQENINSYSIDDVGGGWYKVAFNFTQATSSGCGGGWTVGFTNTTANCVIPSYATAGTETFEIYNIQIRHEDSAPTDLIAFDHAIYRGSPKGKAGINFDGNDDNLITTATLDDLVNADAKTAIVVFSPTSSGAETRLLFDINQNFGFKVIHGSPPSAEALHIDGGGLDTKIAGTFAYDKPHVWWITHDGTNLKTAIDGGSVQTQASGATADMTQVQFLSHPTWTYQGNIYEVVTFDRVLPVSVLAEMVQGEDGLCRKWGADC